MRAFFRRPLPHSEMAPPLPDIPLALGLDQIPRIGDSVHLLRDFGDGVGTEAFTVRNIVWYPQGDPDSPEAGDRFVMIVLR